MKKILAMLLALIMVFGLVACAQTEAPAQTPATDAPAEKPAETPAEETPAEKPAEETEAPVEEEPAGLTGEITFATTFNNVADTTIKALAEEFMAANPGTTIKVQAIGDAQQELSVLMASNSLPDIAPLILSLSPSDFDEYFIPLDDLFTSDELAGYDYGVGDDGHLYGLNSAVSYNGVVYNKAVFAAAGITEIPLTVEDFMAACEKIKAIGAIPVASNFKDAWPLSIWPTTLAGSYQNSTNVHNDATAADELIVEGNGIDFSLKLIQELNDKGYLEPDLFSTNWESSKTEMASGQIAMMMMASWLPQQIVDLGANLEDIGMFPYPGSKGIVLTGDWKYGVSKSSENPELAKAFLKWLWDEGRFMQATGLDCPLTSVKSDKPWLAEITSFGYPYISNASDSDALLNIRAEAEYDFGATMVQDYLVAEDKAAFVAETNALWKDSQQ